MAPNGDLIAGDHIWTAQYNVIQSGTYDWGAVSTSNGDGNICSARDGSDGHGTWLIEGDLPSFNLSGSGGLVWNSRLLLSHQNALTEN